MIDVFFAGLVVVALVITLMLTVLGLTAWVAILYLIDAISGVNE